MKNLIKILVVSLLFVGNTFAQKYTGFQLLNKNHEEHGWQMVVIKPLNIDAAAPKDTKEWKVYGFIICYTVDGVEKVAKKDITYDIVNQGEYEFVLSYSEDRTVVVKKWETFYLPENNGPVKDTYCN